jgi:ParB family chromosome partitioning protein
MKDEPDSAEHGEKNGNGTRRLSLDLIEKSPFQPRLAFAEEGMDDLVRSVKLRGVVQPVLVRRKGDKYELIAGERRYRAAREAKLADIPAIVMEANDQEVLELALVENLMREDLNPMEQAEGYKKFVDQFGLTQEQIAERIGKPRATIANFTRLLDLPNEVKEYIRQNQLQAGHGKVLLGLEIAEERILLARQVIKEGLSVRDLEVLVARSKRGPRRRRASHEDIQPVHSASISDTLRRRLGTSVRLTSCRTLANGKKVKGSVEIDFFSVEDLNRILEVLGIPDAN